MRKLVLLGMVLTLAGCGLSEDDRMHYIRDMEEALADCRATLNLPRCGDYNQLKLALIEDKRLEDY